MTHRCPHRCPVCNGSGSVDEHFYKQSPLAGTTLNRVPCRSCGGAGVVWHEAETVEASPRYVTASIVAWLDENVRHCAHGSVHVTCGDCSPLQVTP